MIKKIEKLSILIVNPRFSKTKGDFNFFPFGLAYISAALKTKKYNVHCLDLNYYSEPIEELLKKKIIEEKINIVCTGGISEFVRNVMQVIHYVKWIEPNIITILGGALLTGEPELMMEALKVDYGVIGEGDITIVELIEKIVQGKDFDKVNGIIYWGKDGKLIKTTPREEIDDIDSIPWPDYDGFEIEKHIKNQLTSDCYWLNIFDNPVQIPILASRSCPYRCTFCFHAIKTHRQRSLDDLFKEIDYLYLKFKPNILVMFDDLFSLSKKRVLEFSRRIKKYDVKWVTNFRVNAIDKEMLEVMKDSGCFYMSLGIESVNDEILKSFNKKITSAQIKKTLSLISDAGIGIQGNLIFGDCEETWETAQSSIQWWIENRKYQINLAPITLYPGSALYTNAVEKGVIKDKFKFFKDNYPFVNISKMTDSQFEKLHSSFPLLELKHSINPYHLDISKGEVIQGRGQIYKLNALCPHCNNTVEYMRIEAVQKLICKICNKRFNLPLSCFHDEIKNLQQRVDTMFNQGLGKELAIWGVSHFTEMLFHTSIFSRCKILYIFDNDPKKHGTYFFGHEVIPFSKAHDYYSAQFDSIIICSKTHGEEIYKQISFLNKHKITVFKLFE